MMGSPGGSKGKLSQQQGVTGQSSMNNPTLDEVQNQLGEPFSSLSLDELIENVWTSEGSQPLAMDVEGTSASGSQTNLQYQSSLSLTGTQTVDEVWRDIQQNMDRNAIAVCGVDPGIAAQFSPHGQLMQYPTQPQFLHPSPASEVDPGIAAKFPQHGQLTQYPTQPQVLHPSPASGVDPGIAAQFPPHGQLMHYPTYPQFLHPSPASEVDPGIAAQFPPHGEWMQYPTQPQFLHPSLGMMGGYMPPQALPQQPQMGVGSMMDLQYIDRQLALTSPLMGTPSDAQTSERKRGSSADVIKDSVERRKIRMMKNRESAARSRAKKQARLNKLEQENSRLREEYERHFKENSRLREELENMFTTSQPPKPRNQLRRASSAPF